MPLARRTTQSILSRGRVSEFLSTLWSSIPQSSRDDLRPRIGVAAEVAAGVVAAGVAVVAAGSTPLAHDRALTPEMPDCTRATDEARLRVRPRLTGVWPPASSSSRLESSRSSRARRSLLCGMSVSIIKRRSASRPLPMDIMHQPRSDSSSPNGSAKALPSSKMP
eukprot:scaffold44215_cov69-Phaeocystis_antarctica.AAC.8